jgi:hypothetical protein
VATTHAQNKDQNSAKGSGIQNHWEEETVERLATGRGFMYRSVFVLWVVTLCGFVGGYQSFAHHFSPEDTVCFTETLACIHDLPASYSKSSGLKSRPGDRLSSLTCFVVFLSPSMRLPG